MSYQERKKTFKIGSRVEWTTKKYGTLLGTVRTHTSFGVVVKLDDKHSVTEIRPKQLKLIEEP